MFNRMAILIFIFVAFVLVPLTASAEDWECELELYSMATSIKGDASVGRINGVDVDMNFSDILEDLQMAGMARFEAVHESGWGVALDYGFMRLKDDMTGPVGAVGSVKTRQGILQADAIYRMPKKDFTVDLIAGARWWDNDLDVTLSAGAGGISRSIEKDWIDLFIGAKTDIPLAEKWSAALRGDIGGLGIESDFTACLSGYIRYALSKNWMMNLGYKALWVDYEEGTKGQSGYFSYDTVTHGPVLGIIYKF